MAKRGGPFANFGSVSQAPEMRSFWGALFALLLVLVVDFVLLELYYAIFAAVAILVACYLTFRSIYSSAEKSQQTNQERSQLRSMVTTMDDALVVYDQNFTLMFFNPAAERVFKISAAEFLGTRVEPKLAENPALRRFAQVIFPSLAPSMITRSPAGKYPQVVDLSFDDPYLELRTFTSPILDDAGNLSGFMKIIRDRTREVSLAKEKSEFVTVTSHQLRTPLTHIVWALESINKEESLGAEVKALAENAYAAANQLRTIVEDLLNISRIEEGRFGYQFQKANILEFVENILNSAAANARQLGIKIYFNRPEEAVPELMIDPQKLSMALTNLVDNAIRYNVKNGEVIVGLKKAEKGPYVEISVRDTGIGIPPEEIKKLFVKFFRATNALKFATEGSGLGLYITQNIIRAHGGSMNVESEMGRGSTFSFTLPTDPTLIPPKEVPLEY